MCPAILGEIWGCFPAAVGVCLVLPLWAVPRDPETGQELKMWPSQIGGKN